MPQRQEHPQQQQEYVNSTGTSTGRYTKDKRRVALLEQQLQDLKLQQTQLQQSHHTLQLQAAIAQDLCDLLHALLQRMTELQSRSSADPQVLEALSELIAQEISQLLPGQATSSLNQGSAVESPPGSAAPGTIKTIAPLSAPFTHFREAIARGPLPEAASMTALQMIEVGREAALQSGVLLLQMPQQSEQQKQDSLCQLQQLWDRHHELYTSVFLVGDCAACFEAISTTNMVTMQHDAEGSEAAAAGVHKLLPALGLTHQQQEVIAISYSLFLRQHERIIVERRQLQQQVAATDSITCCVPGASTAGSRQLLNSTSSEQQLPNVWGKRRVELDNQDQILRKLHKLLQKEMVLRVVAAAGIVGCLSWEQVARMGALWWPYHVRLMVLAKAVYEQWNNQAQDEQQHPPPPPGKGFRSHLTV